MVKQWYYQNTKRSRFIKKQEAKETLSSLGLKAPLSKVPLLGDILFSFYNE